MTFVLAVFGVVAFLGFIAFGLHTLVWAVRCLYVRPKPKWGDLTDPNRRWIP